MELRLKLSIGLVHLEVHQEDPEAVEVEGQVDLVEVGVGDLVLVGVVALEEVVPVDLDRQVMLEVLVVLVDQDLWRKLFLEFLEMIIQSLVMYQRPLSFAMVKLTEVIMLIQKLNVKHFISVLAMEMVD